MAKTSKKWENLVVTIEWKTYRVATTLDAINLHYGFKNNEVEPKTEEKKTKKKKKKKSE